MDAITDVITNQGITGNVASRLLNSGFNVNALRTNTLLRKDEWKAMDDTVVQISRDRLVGANDLVSRGLVFNITNGLGTTVLEYEDLSDMSAAEMDMTAVKRSASDAVKYAMNYLPLPIIHKDFSFNIRRLEASRKLGMALDMTQTAIATTKCAEFLETLLFVGTGGITYGGGTIYGYMNHPNRCTASLTANWDDSAATGAVVIQDVLTMKQAAIDAKHYGPWILYIPTNFDAPLDDEYSTANWSGGKTIRARIKEIEGVEDVKVSDKLTNDNVILAEMRQESVRMVIGLQPTVVEWNTEGGMVSHFKVMEIMVPQIRADQDGNCGIVHAS